MPEILKTSRQEIDQALRNVTRQYLVGDLQKPQALQHVPSSLIEIGITRYENEGKLEPLHRHEQAFEFQYMTAGLTAYLNLITAEEHVFSKGDFYVIEPGVLKWNGSFLRKAAHKACRDSKPPWVQCHRTTMGIPLDFSGKHGVSKGRLIHSDKQR